MNTAGGEARTRNENPVLFEGLPQIFVDRYPAIFFAKTAQDASHEPEKRSPTNPTTQPGNYHPVPETMVYNFFLDVANG